MIAIRLQGRLGNQLFQYAFILAAAKKLNTGFYVDEYISPCTLENYFEVNNANRQISKIFKINGFKNIFNHHLRLFYYKAFANFNKLKICNQEDQPCDLKDQTLFIGYFQSEKYFHPYQNLIIRSLKLKNVFVEQFSKKYSQLYAVNTVVTVHIRRTDYGDLGHLNLGNADLTLPLSYYKNAIQELNDKNVHYIFVTDDHQFVKENFDYLTNKTISEESEMIDLQHLINADVCIIANSTFSWWGAWLNSNPNKVVYCPKYFMGFYIKTEIPRDIYPQSWRQINFDVSQ